MYAHFFFFNDTATTEIYTLSLHDALPIWKASTMPIPTDPIRPPLRRARGRPRSGRDRKSTRLNSSHGYISYAVFCLKKKKSHLTTQSTSRMLPNISVVRAHARKPMSAHTF